MSGWIVHFDATLSECGIYVTSTEPGFVSYWKTDPKHTEIPDFKTLSRCRWRWLANWRASLWTGLDRCDSGAWLFRTCRVEKAK